MVLKQETIFKGSFDGIVGLAYKEMAQPGILPFFDQMMGKKVIEKNIFAFFLSYNPRKESSEITFGYYDPNRFVPESLHWHDVTNKVFFALELTDLRVGDVSLGLCGPNGLKKTCTITPDSGTS